MISQVGHLVLALAVLAGVCVLAAIGTIPGADAFTVIVGVAVGGGVLAGANLSPSVPPPPAPPSLPAGPPAP